MDIRSRLKIADGKLVIRAERHGQAANLNARSGFKAVSFIFITI